jgi:hypothetical protein
VELGLAEERVTELGVENDLVKAEIAEIEAELLVGAGMAEQEKKINMLAVGILEAEKHLVEKEEHHEMLAQ